MKDWLGIAQDLQTELYSKKDSIPPGTREFQDALAMIQTHVLIDIAESLRTIAQQGGGYHG